MSLAGLKRFLGLVDREHEANLLAIARRREELSALSSDRIKSAAAGFRNSPDAIEVFALTAVIAERVLGLRMFEVQLSGALV